MMLEIVREWRQKNGKSTSNINLTTYQSGTDEQKATWGETYMNKIVARLMIMNCADRSITTKIDKATRIGGHAQYPMLIPKESALLTASARDKKKKNKAKKEPQNNSNNNNGNNGNVNADSDEDEDVEIDNDDDDDDGDGNTGNTSAAVRFAMASVGDEFDDSVDPNEDIIWPPVNTSTVTEHG